MLPRPLALALTALLAPLLALLTLTACSPPVATRPATTSVTTPTATAAPTGSTPRPSATARPHATPDSPLPRIRERDLPSQARRTLELIEAGGPYPYRQDGRTFGNRERLLPRRPGGYYREFTVVTPGEGDRGPRRIVAGDEGDLYWTRDHYASFA